jgi:hypothetical protein
VDLIHGKMSVYSDEGAFLLHVYYNARAGLISIYNELILSIGFFIIVVTFIVDIHDRIFV